MCFVNWDFMLCTGILLLGKQIIIGEFKPNEIVVQGDKMLKK